MTPRLKEKYQNEAVPKLMEQFKYGNKMEVPRLEKITINMGLGKALEDPKLIQSAVGDLAAITGQRPVVTQAKKAISNFKLRKGLQIGASVTLRASRMYEFLDRFCNVALPRVRDFKGIPSKSFDHRGNYTVGIREHIIFPEIDVDKMERPIGMNITFVTTAKTDEEGKSLLKLLGMPFREN